MAILAGLCGVLIVVFGLLTTRHSPTDAQFGIEVTCLVGGLVLIFLGVLIGRVGRLSRLLDHAIGEVETNQAPDDPGSHQA